MSKLYSLTKPPYPHSYAQKVWVCQDDKSVTCVKNFISVAIKTHNRVVTSLVLHKCHTIQFYSASKASYLLEIQGNVWDYMGKQGSVVLL